MGVFWAHQGSAPPNLCNCESIPSPLGLTRRAHSSRSQARGLMGARRNPWCSRTASPDGARGGLPFFTHQSATQISIWALSSSSCHTPSITKSTSCLLKHHLERGDGEGMWQKATAQKSPPPRSPPPLTTLSEVAPRGLLYWTRYMVVWAFPLASPFPSTILHQALGSRRLTCMSLVFVGTGTQVQMEAHTEQGILESPK